MQKSLSQILKTDIRGFFDAVRGIRYGYADTDGKTHPLNVGDNYADQKEKFTYAFSSPEAVVKNNCGWCWDVANLIRCYCRHNGLTYKFIFMEYKTADLHLTHTQVFVLFEGKWYEAPDNSSPVAFGETGYDSAETCIASFVSAFSGYLKYTLKDRYDESALLVKESDCDVPAGISDEEYLNLMRTCK